MDYLTLVQRWVEEDRLEAERAGPVWLVSAEAFSRFVAPPRKWSTKPRAKASRRR